ncbi:MAG: bifunctional diaminohydroxyphosphoribosylaminopyrimidine deaminase/5-amino-6-(5-phosphoribosylamino)uracil reductase RibD, partial [Kiritimatiellae bacterium]|nr:bifunctional diaminohydroxyphosphoribosylaminopyrimidine deaminase/5-amino-6-(5-phosphoribosylamino)uracil reductase RibD [Kiritimatiellia bacterium]
MSDRKHSDEYWMRTALRLAKKAEGLTRPNPPVGAVVVRKNAVAGSGFHKKAGDDHAEVIALADAGKLAKQDVLYVTLEPCSTHQKTPPCTDAILKSGISRVVVSVRDPNPRHRGKGLRILRANGATVDEGICNKEGMELIAPFKKWVLSSMPFVSLKMGMSLDGRIS